jgi:ribonuclease BN (tRNA processing enzyme)
VIFSYLRDYIEDIVILEEGGTYPIGNVSLTTPLRHRHPVETYGMVFKTPEHSFAYIADTSPFDKLAEVYAEELIIINTVLTEPRPPIQHLSVPDAARLIKEIRPKTAILTHYGLRVWQEKPPQIAEDLSQKTGVKVIAAKDGMKFDMAQLDDIQITGRGDA